jgi:phospholipase C
MLQRLRILALLGLVVSGACSSGNTVPSFPAAQPASYSPTAGGPVGKYLKHIVVIIQENRSFENFFAGYPGADAPMYGYALKNGGRVKVLLHGITFHGSDLRHDWYSSMVDWDNGRMDGFDAFGRNPPNPPNAAYAYVKQDLIVPYWTMAHQYVLLDHLFPTEFGGSFTAHLTLIAGTDNLTPTTAEVDFPSAAPDDCDSPPGTHSDVLDNLRKETYDGPYPCFTQFNTIAKTLDAANVSWKIYATHVLDAGMWEPFEAIKAVRYGSDWSHDIIAPQKRVIMDAKDGNLASVTWVTPTPQDSDHPAYFSDRGPSWVASVVNAVGESRYWDSSAIIVLWDDWGGWYDNAPPPQLDFRGLGIRVPCLIISPYARKGYVEHVEHEYGSILKLIEQMYGLPPLGSRADGYTDTRANGLLGVFDFTQKPRPFVPIKAKYPPSAFLTEPPSDLPVDTQ